MLFERIESLQGCIQGYSTEKSRPVSRVQEAVRANPVNAVPFSDKDETTAKSEAERENRRRNDVSYLTNKVLPLRELA
jgi:hypothetical protein